MATPKTGRPRGRPRGTVRSHAGEIRKAIAQAAPELVQGLIQAAQAGDIQASVALLDRVAPRLRAAAAPVSCDTTGSAQDVAQRLLRAVGKGEIDAPSAIEVLSLVRAALGDEPPRHEPIDHEKLEAIYQHALAEAERKRLEVRHRSDPDFYKTLGLEEELP